MHFSLFWNRLCSRHLRVFFVKAQTASPTFTHVYAGLAAIINTKFPNIGELLLKRLIINFKRGFKRKVIFFSVHRIHLISEFRKLFMISFLFFLFDILPLGSESVHLNIFADSNIFAKSDPKHLSFHY